MVQPTRNEKSHRLKSRDESGASMAIFKSAVPKERMGFMHITIAAGYLKACFTIETVGCSAITGACPLRRRNDLRVAPESFLRVRELHGEMSDPSIGNGTDWRHPRRPLRCARTKNITMNTTLEDFNETDDEELMKDLVQRVPEAIERLHRRYRTLLRSIIMQVLHDDTEADDVLQEVLLQVWNRAENYSSLKGKLVSWLCTLSRRRAIDRLRQHSAYRRATDRYEVSCNHFDKEVVQLHPVEHQASLEEIRCLLHRHLTALPPNQEQAVRMAFLENRSQREISTLTKTPLGTVKTRIELGIKKLTNAFEGMRGEMV